MDPQFLEQLHDSSIFPDSGDSVAVLQTHLSVVCLTGRRAYKFKKPIKLDFVDYSTLARRKIFCSEEVRLNRRLCPEIYLDVVSLVRLPDGALRIGGGEGKSNGEIIDYAVEMVRLPEDRMLDRLLKDGAVTSGQIREVAYKVASFHRNGERGREVDACGNPEHLARFALENFEETRSAVGTIFDPTLHRKLEEKTRRDFEQLIPDLGRRVGEGRVVDGHGDLHARNICLSDPMAIYDCIEFNRDFRCSDTALENAFLVMDLQYRGHPELAATYLDAYVESSGDGEQGSLMPALVRYRAMVRAKVSAIAAGEEELSGEEKKSASAEARRYFHFSAASAIVDQSWLVICCGLPGSGKSCLCRAMGEETGWATFGSDRVRKEMAGVEPHERLDRQFYSPSFSEGVYRELIERGIDTAEQHGVALMDANFRTRSLRKMAREAAGARNLKLAILQIELPESLAIERLAERKEENREASDADIAVYRQLKAEYERPEPSEADRLVIVDGQSEKDRSIPEILSELMD